MTLAFPAIDFEGSGQCFEVHRCASCGTGATHPAPGPDEISRYYAPDYYGQGNRKFSALIEWVTTLGQRLLAGRIISQWSAGDTSRRAPRVLDIGCGRATLLRFLHARGCECHGVERGDFPDLHLPDGITINKTSLEQCAYPDRYFDIVVIWHVLEHLHQPAEILREVSRIIATGGLLVVAVPNFSSWQAGLFARHWFHLDLPRHLFHFSRTGLELALTHTGFTMPRTHTCSPSQGIYGFIQSAMNAFPGPGRPNAFYELLKHRQGLADTLRLLLYLACAVVLAPIALAGFAVSCLFGKGACLMMSTRPSTAGKDSS